MKRGKEIGRQKSNREMGCSFFSSRNELTCLSCSARRRDPRDFRGAGRGGGGKEGSKVFRDDTGR